MKIRRLTDQVTHRWTGLKNAIQSESNFRLHAIAATLAATAGMYFDLQHIEWLCLLTVILIVFLAELLNTAIERITDIASPHFSGKAGEIKDIAAGAVLLAAIAAMVSGILIFYPDIEELYHNRF